MNCCLQNILYINLHILYIIHIKTSSKIQELQESNKYIKSYQQKRLNCWKTIISISPTFLYADFWHTSARHPR